MGLFDRNITGLDINHDGRKDSLDDFIFFESMKSMEEEERIEVFEAAGLNPDDYNFD